MKQLSLLEEAASEADPGVQPAASNRGVRALAAGLDARLRLGTSSWSFPGWSGLVYACSASKQRLSRGGLRAYGQHPLLRTVGVDSGYYAPLDACRLHGYAEQVPRDFRFLVKVPASVTDPFRRGADGRIRGPNPGFLDAGLALEQAVKPYCEGLRERAGVLLFQFPPLGRELTGNPRRFAEVLYRFLRRLPKTATYAVELRDEALLTPDLAAALQHGGAVAGLAEHPRLPALDAQDELFGGRGDGPLVIRWLLRRNRGYDEARQRYHPFDRLAEPNPRARDGIAALVVQALRQGREVFVIVNNKAEGSSPLSLIELARRIRDQDAS